MLPTTILTLTLILKTLIMSNDPAGRVQLTLDPALPSLCIVCNRSSGNNVKFVDFNVSLDWYGAVVICEDCIKECITVVEYEKVANLELELHSKENELEQAYRELQRYKSALDGLSFIRPDLNPLSDVDEVESNDDSEIETEGPGNLSGTSESGEGGESNSDGSDSVGGLENVSIFATDN